MKLEMQKIAGEETPTIISECMKCGGDISVGERDFLLSRPIHCRSCNHNRFLSYREYVVAFDAIAPGLLAHSVSRIDKGIRRQYSHH